MIYVLSINGKALMPTSNAKCRILLKEKRARVIELKPFTIQLNYRTETEYTQEITLGVDSGYNNVGFSATTKNKELIVGVLKLLQGIKERLLDRANYRRNRRLRLRYRKPKYKNRIKSKPKGWLSPSLKHKLNSHINLIDSLYKIMPITKCIIEVGNFDIQKMKKDNIEGSQYQEGDMMGFWNTREYILHRDGHKCQNPDCKNKDKEQILQIHHIKFRSQGGTNAPANLITLCTNCHTSPNHKKGNFLYDWSIDGKKVRGFKDATFMSLIRWYVINNLKHTHKNIYSTYGYITKNYRIENGIEKTHYNDAFAIIGGIGKSRNNKIYDVKQSRRNNRSLEKFYDAKYIDIRTGEKVKGGYLNNGRTTRNKKLSSENLHKYRGEKMSKGQRRIRKSRYFYQPNALVKYNGKIYKVKGTQNRGSQVKLDGINNIPSPRLLTLYRFNKGMVWN